MDILGSIVEILKKIPKDYYLPIGFGCAGLMLFVYGFFAIAYKPQLRENSSTFDISQKDLASKSANMQAMIAVDVEGAVLSPGVYSVAQESRVQDALMAAGGLSGNADRPWIAQHSNLATKLTDGSKIYIPSIGETSIAKTSQAQGSSNMGDVLGASTNQQININTASASDLDSLPGIGQTTAKKIIAGRPYASIQDLQTNKIVGTKEFEKIKDLIIAQ